MNIPRNKMLVWCNEGRDDESVPTIEVVLDYKTPTGQNERICMLRKSDELFEQTKQRLGVKLNNLSNPKSRKSKKALPDDQILPSISALDKDGVSIVLESAINSDVFKNAKSITLEEDLFEVIQDAPYIEKLAINVVPMVGCPVMASCEWKAGCSNPQEVRFQWYVAPENQSPIVTRDGEELVVENGSLAHTGEIFSPLDKHVGMNLCLVAVVRFAGEWLAKTCNCKTPIQRIQEDFLFKQRQVDYCSQKLSGTKFRLVSYNVLADLYLNLKQEQEKLFFAYCPKEYQEPAYRYPIIMKELNGYNADLMFLQEVDYRFSYRFLTKFLLSCGFSSTFRVKEKEVNEGLMIAFRSERLRMVDDSYSVRISDLLDENPENKDIVEYLTRHPDVGEIMTAKPNVFQVVYLKTSGDIERPILACNTHLAFDPNFENVKLIQALLCGRYITRVKSKLDLSDMLVLYCGDLNSTEDSAVARLLQGGSIKSDDEVWGGEDGFRVEEKYNYSSVAGFPKYTNFTRGFHGCLDYIWNSGSLVCEQIVPMPEHDLVVKYEAIPSKIAPSDHLPIICDVDMKLPDV
uniref:Endonuclease/exonuclease/phosphatase domain-containing protein n=1 Tax=Ditylenchus dipsaci TaxID=166011 RepID=A0A915D3E1_9BILA